MKKFTALFLIVAFIMSFFTGTTYTVDANESGGISLGSSETFFDICYNNNPVAPVYVAITKDSGNTSKIYTSTDLINWGTAKLTVPNTSAVNDYTNRIVWWSSKNAFAVVLGNKIYFSPDGNIWTTRTIQTTVDSTTTVYSDNSNASGANKAISNLTIETNGEDLIISGGRRVIVLDTLPAEGTPIETKKNYLTIDVQERYTKALGISPSNSDATKVYYEALGNNYIWYQTEQAAVNNGAGFGSNASPSGITDNRISANYIPKYDKWLVTDNTLSLGLLTAPSAYSKVESVKLSGEATNGANFISSAVNSNTIAVGTAAGNIYTLPHSETVFNADTVWDIAQADEDIALITEEIRAIYPITDNDFLVASTSKLYKLAKSETGYVYTENLEFEEDFVFVAKPELTRDNPFTGVKLIGGAYSPELDVHVVYGTAVVEGVTKCIIFASDDGGINWEKKDIGSAVPLATANGMVWWEKQGMFVLACLSTATWGRYYTSEDGKTWSFPGKDLLGGEAEIATAGDYLYSAGAGKSYHKYIDFTATDKNDSKQVLTDIASMPTTAVTLRKIAVSSGNDPAILMATHDNYQGVVRNNDSSVETEAERWKYKGNVTGGGLAVDMKYIDNIDKFLLTSKSARMQIIDKSAEISNGPANPAGMFIQYFDTNGKKFVFGTNNTNDPSTATSGTLYTAVDDEHFTDTTALTQILPKAGTQANTMPITNVILGKGDQEGKNNQFLVTVSDGTDSNVLIVDAEAQSYCSVDNIFPETLEEGMDIEIKVDYTNKKSDDVSLMLTTAIYNEEQLIQVQTEDVTLEKGSHSIKSSITTNEHMTDESYMRVFVWDRNMEPMLEATDFFEKSR